MSSSPTVRGFRARRTKRAQVSQQQRIADAITRFSGSMPFVALHVVWFALWIAYNLVAADPFDPFPFGLLTMVVSLEAIFLSTFVLISQNRQSMRTDERAHQDFETNVYAEALSELISERLGVEAHDVQERFHQRMAEAKAQDDANPNT